MDWAEFHKMNEQVTKKRNAEARKQARKEAEEIRLQQGEDFEPATAE